MKHFIVDETPISPGNYIVRIKIEAISGMEPLTGALGILFSRLFGLSFADYLRMCRDVYGGRIMGKNHKYPIIYFSNKQDASRFANELDKRFDVYRTWRLSNGRSVN